MKRKYTEILFDAPELRCWIAFRLHSGGAITGHYKADDRQTYHNTAPLCKDWLECEDGKVDQEGLYTLLGHATGWNVTQVLTETCLKAIHELQALGRKA